ncbi:MAG: V-type ATPase subunit [Deltaproteobacteria bacterium]|nr:V-type ATPase subunit [Deltaproteobacteria bacterium]
MDLGYYNARIRGLRGRLLKEADYDAMLKAVDLERYLERLKSTAYGPFIETAGARFVKPSEVISGALRANLAETFDFLWKIAPNEAKPLLKAIFSIWEVYDIKTLIRGVARGVKKDDILEALIPAGDLDQAALNILLGAKDIQDLIQILHTLGSPYSKPLKAGLPQYARTGNIVEMELNLDINSFKFLRSRIEENYLNDRIIREFIILRIDIENILTVFKIAGENYSKEGAQSFFIEGGVRLRRSEFLTFSELKNRDEVLKALKEKILDVDIKEILLSSDPEDIALIEERLESSVENRLARQSLVEPLSIALAASFIFIKIREIKNLRLIARGKAFGIPDDELRRLIIYPI